MSKEEDFTRIFILVLGFLVVFTIVIALIARSVGLDENSGPMTDKDINARTQPYGTVNVPQVEVPAAPMSTPANAQTEEPAVVEPMTAEPSEVAPAAAEASETAMAEAAPAIDGKALYAACMGCHQIGVAGAPKLGDKAGWAQRMAGGIDALVASAIQGKGAMPPKGGRMDYSEDQIRAIVEYMVAESQ